MIETVIENQWLTVDSHRPPVGRLVLARFADGHLAAAKWNGYYWVGQHDIRFMRGDTVAAFLIFPTYDPDDLY